MESYLDLSQVFTTLAALSVKAAITVTFVIITIQGLIIDDLKYEFFVITAKVIKVVFIKVRLLIFSDNPPHFIILFISTTLTILVAIILTAIILLIMS